MIEFRPYYQFGYFLPHGILPEPETSVQLTGDFAPLGMIPSTVQGTMFAIGSNPGINMVPQLQFITPFKNLTIDFEPNRYLIQMIDVPNYPLPTFEVFYHKVQEIIAILERRITVKASRMSFVTTGLYRRMPELEIAQAHSNLFVLPEQINGRSFVEWNNRQVYREKRRINTRDELENIIMTINRVQIDKHPDERLSEYKGIEITFDINTYQDNNEQRFTSNDIIPFLMDAASIKEELETSIGKIISTARS
jgi:hypothetical protein